MNCPPIPLNCHNFKDGVFWWANGEFSRLDNPDQFPRVKEERRIIAAVARCAWFDEGIKKDGWTLERFKECTDNFEAWRLWGLMK